MNYPSKYWRVLVEPECQGKGIGSRVYDHLMEELSKVGAVTAWANARDDYPQHLDFVRRRGFRELWRNINQRLSLEEVDLGRKEELTATERTRDHHCHALRGLGGIGTPAMSTQASQPDTNGCAQGGLLYTGHL